MTPDELIQMRDEQLDFAADALEEAEARARQGLDNRNWIGLAVGRKDFAYSLDAIAVRNLEKQLQGVMAA